MDAATICPKCGFVNESEQRSCWRCGRPLPGMSDAGQAFDTDATLPERRPVRSPFPTVVDRQRPLVIDRYSARFTQVENAKTGILLLAASFLMSWIPVVSLVGGVIGLAGAILVTVGRKAFGPAHARNVVLALILLLGGILAVVLLAVLLGVVLAFTAYFYGAAVIAVATGLSSVLFTYALQRPFGRGILWAAWGSQSAIEVAILSAIGPRLWWLFASGSYDLASLEAVLADAERAGLLGVVPSVLLTAAYYFVWRRIRQGEVPEPESSAVTREDIPP